MPRPGCRWRQAGDCAAGGGSKGGGAATEAGSGSGAEYPGVCAWRASERSAGFPKKKKKGEGVGELHWGPGEVLGARGGPRMLSPLGNRCVRERGKEARKDLVQGKTRAQFPLARCMHMVGCRGEGQGDQCPTGGERH